MLSPGTQQRILTALRIIPFSLLSLVPQLQPFFFGAVCLALLVEYRKVLAHTRTFLRERRMLYGKDYESPVLGPFPFGFVNEIAAPVKVPQANVNGANGGRRNAGHDHDDTETDWATTPNLGPSSPSTSAAKGSLSLTSLQPLPPPSSAYTSQESSAAISRSQSPPLGDSRPVGPSAFMGLSSNGGGEQAVRHRAPTSGARDGPDDGQDVDGSTSSKKPSTPAKAPTRSTPQRAGREPVAVPSSFFSLRRLIKRALFLFPAIETSPDLVLMTFGTILPTIPALLSTFFGVPEHRIPFYIKAWQGISFMLLVLAHLVQLAPPEEKINDPGMRVRRFETVLLEMGGRVFGFVWIAVAMGDAVAMLRHENGTFRFLVIVVFTALGDTSGYFFGRAFGRTHIVPGISPKKTLEGFLGNILAPPIFLILAIRNVPAIAKVLPSLMRVEWVCLVWGIFGSTAGVIGDLAESFIKRAAGVKDSGDVFAGHGGWLDRLDSYLLSVPFAYFTWTLMDEAVSR
ncbi:hypothetical protein M427DRAFT_155153 [Gonapodya prolifera JEL478]|uniref:Phosphatidate cytidylyltransferase n=1 Tax=Gonapodya prolifera (strain JEL478) TaxID=1344416 RepID=A0A139AGM7_GONPJ|nr:hypothetical protein M427DRAFT_155153 [Gonapodya prolifera JEL478]|eukprot:KXS15898.1 hypothetical protein M427DRAFT_155153 [Gonapodya prolifera JEL478]